MEENSIQSRIKVLENEIKRVEKLEFNLMRHEILLTKKIRDMNSFEKKIVEFVDKKELKKLNNELKRIDSHEELIFESAKYIKELVKELSKVRESHKLTNLKLLNDDSIKKKDFDTQMEGIKEGLEDLENIRVKHKNKADNKDLFKIRNELEERMNQIEYQQKIIIQYLKKIIDKQ